MALKAAPADQALLLDLQALDTRLQQLAHRVRNLPQTAAVADLEAERTEVQRTFAERMGALEDARAELGRTESDVAVVDARIARDSERLRSTASVKDVQALEQELEALAKRKSDLEDIQLAVMETVEEREAEVEETRAELERIDGRLTELTAERDTALAQLEAERTAAQNDRGVVAGKLPPDLLALYEKQRERYGVGASHLRGGVTSASGVSLNASDMNTIRAAAPEDVLICPDSNAILVRTAESGL